MLGRSAIVSIVLLGASLTLSGGPATVLLDSGEQIIGQPQASSDASTLVLRSALLGEVRIPRDRIEAVTGLDPAAIEAAPAPSEAPAPAEPKPAPQPGKDAVAEREPAPVDEVAAAAEPKPEKTSIVDLLAVDQIRQIEAPEHWSGNMRFGLNLSQGDRRWEELYFRGNLEMKRPQSPHFFRFSGSYTYRQNERDNGTSFKSTDKYDGQIIYRFTFWDHWFLQNSTGGRVDRIKGIERELQEAVGIGYSFEPTENLQVLVGGGGGVEELQTATEDTRSGLNPLGNVFQETTWRPFKRTSIVQKFNYYWNPDDSDQFNYVLTAAVRVRLTDLLGLEFSFNKSFDNDVGDGDARDDTRWRNALVVYF